MEPFNANSQHTIYIMDLYSHSDIVKYLVPPLSSTLLKLFRSIFDYRNLLARAETYLPLCRNLSLRHSYRRPPLPPCVRWYHTLEFPMIHTGIR
jgi:hypothetical protein